MIWTPSAQDGWSLSWFIPMLNFEIIKNKTKHNKKIGCFQNFSKLNLLQRAVNSSYILHVGDLFRLFFPWYLAQKFMERCVEDNSIIKEETEAAFI